MSDGENPATFSRSTVLSPRGQKEGGGLTGGIDDDVYRRLLRERIVFLGRAIDDELANAVCARLLLLSAEDPRRNIRLYINSPGGSVYSGLAIYDTMQFVPNDVATVVVGMAGSMGQFLLTAGAPGKRYATPNSTVVMHQPHGGLGGTASDIAIQAEQMLHMKRRIAEITAERTGKTVDQIDRDGDRDRWYTAEQAKEYGFVDHVYTNEGEIPSEQ